MLLISFKDACDASVLDPNATVGVFYCDGHYANEAAVRARCPHARLYAITVFGQTGKDVFACDCETGDLTVAQAETWVVEQLRLGVSPVCVYACRDRWLNQGLLAGLAKYDDQIRRWDADYDGVAAVPTWADAEQYADGTADLDVARSDFFAAATPAPAPVHWWSAELQVSVPAGSTGTLHFHGSVNLEDGGWTAAGLPGVPHWLGPGGGHWRIRGLQLDAPPLGS